MPSSSVVSVLVLVLTGIGTTSCFTITPHPSATGAPAPRTQQKRGVPQQRRLRTTSTLKCHMSSANTPPPPPTFSPAPLPVMLAGGLFLFASSVKPKDRAFANDLLAEAQRVLRLDPLVAMELGQGIETGGVYSSARATTEDGLFEQLIVQFQIEGGNAWAQGVAYGIKSNRDPINDGSVQLVSLDIANMDGSMNGTPIHVSIPKENKHPNTSSP